MIVKAWKGGGYSIGVGKPTMNVIINGTRHTFNLSKTFGTTCPEFRGKTIAPWLRGRGALSWPYGKPPSFTLMPLGGNLFRLR